ncbi:hypothetical protein FPOA_05840 [Fusarium poae]|uniref:Major facilitator superfamily (MFS) profile domain-containing protein n=1 Tax=Fusarium poae TaxID=36050 RepID=A0A1B8AXR5_FUSPO|nr:hypothetical protein FPOA_05840 [Fusarium poae]
MASINIDTTPTASNPDDKIHGSGEKNAQPAGVESGQTTDNSASCELQDQSQRLPFVRLMVAYLCLCLAYFISYLDMNSVTTSLPTIAEALDAGPTVTWVGTAYLLGQTAFQPLYGRISDITGRKPILLFSMGCVTIGGLLCGFARTPIWLYACRTISGIGGGGISSSIAIIVSDLVSLRSRGKYQGFISLAIGTGAASGPFVAASLIETRGHSDGWRWAFWVPSILAAFCFTLLLFFLPLKPVSGGFGEKIRKIDWLGVITSVPAIVLVVMSINSGGSIWPWDNIKTILILSIGIVCLLLFIVIEAFVAKIPIIPLRLLKTKSALVLILSGFLHDFVWQTTQYFIPLYFQTVCGYTPLESATLIVSFLIAQGLAGAASGPVMARYARYMPVLRCGLAVWTLGAGLKLLFGQKTHVAIYVVVLAIEGAGVGWVHQPGLVALQANSTDEDRAVATGTRNVFRSLGGVVGIAVSTATYYAVLSKSLGEAVPDWVRDTVLDGTWRAGDSGTSEYESNILEARMEGFRAVFIMSVPMMAICLLASLLVADIILKGDNDNVSEETRSRDGEQRVEAP